MLRIVEHEQRLAVAEMLDDGIERIDAPSGDPQALGHDASYQPTVLQRRQCDHPDAIGPLISDGEADLRGKASLAHPAWSD